VEVQLGMLYYLKLCNLMLFLFNKKIKSKKAKFQAKEAKNKKKIKNDLYF
jgi:hypothetical protein